MRRKRRGLGSSPAEHDKRAAGWKDDTLAHAGDVVRLAEGGRCNLAASATARMNQTYGRYLSEVHGAGKLETSHTIFQVPRAMETFKSRCTQ